MAHLYFRGTQDSDDEKKYVFGISFNQCATSALIAILPLRESSNN